MTVGSAAPYIRWELKVEGRTTSSSFDNTPAYSYRSYVRKKEKKSFHCTCQSKYKHVNHKAVYHKNKSFHYSQQWLMVTMT